MLVVILCMYVSMILMHFERITLMIVMKNVNSQCILMEITYLFFISFTRDANQKSGNSLDRTSQQHFLLSSPGPTKIHQIHFDMYIKASIQIHLFLHKFKHKHVY